MNIIIGAELLDYLAKMGTEILFRRMKADRESKKGLAGGNLVTAKC